MFPGDPNIGKVRGIVRVPVVGLDDRGVTVGWVDPPTFCAGSTEDEINRAHAGDKSVYRWDPGRHKGAKNPTQCETARLYDLASDRWYRESPTSLLKNIGAGLVNSIIPGSDLGDKGSSTQMVGQFIGAFTSFVNPTALANNNMGVLGNIFNSVNKAISSPLGQIGTNFISGLIQPAPPVWSAAAATGNSPTPQAPVVKSVLQTAEKYLPSITEPKQSTAQALAFGDVRVGDYSLEKKTEIPWYAWAIGGVVLLGGLLLLVFKRKR